LAAAVTLEAVSPVSTVSSDRYGSAPLEPDALPLLLLSLLVFPTACATAAPPRAKAATAVTPAATFMILFLMSSLLSWTCSGARIEVPPKSSLKVP
jgi:hypothetical protein